MIESSLKEIEDKLPRSQFTEDTWGLIQDCIHSAYCVGYVDGANRAPVDPYKKIKEENKNVS